MPQRPRSPYGFKPFQRLYSANWYRIASTGKSIFKNDLVRLTTNGVSVGAAGANRLLGSALAFVDGNGVPLSYYASGGQNCKVLVADHPDQLFEAQEDCVATCISWAKVNLAGNLVRNSGYKGNTTTGISQMELDSSTLAATSTRQLLVIGEVTDEDSLGTQAAKSYKRWVVRIAAHNFVHGRKPFALGV